MLKVGRGASGAAVHRDGRDRRGQRAPGRAAAWRAARDPHGGGPAGHRRTGRCGRRRRWRRCARAIRSAIPRHSAAARCASGSSAHYRDWYGLDVPLERVAVTVGASGGISAGVPGGVRSGRPRGADLAVLSALREHPDRARHAAGDPGGGSGDAVPAECRDAGEARSAAGRADRGQPVQSRRHHAASRRTGRDRRVVRRRGRAADQRRDLSRAELRQPDRHARRQSAPVRWW